MTPLKLWSLPTSPSFNFEAELSFRISVKEGEVGNDQSFSGVMTLPELMDAISPEELKVDAKWKSGGPPADLTTMASEWVDKLRGSVRSQAAVFRREYQERR